ncbi:hypothetical protein CHUAL_008486 [Chamberlinius hualienensis]
MFSYSKYLISLCLAIQLSNLVQSLSVSSSSLGGQCTYCIDGKCYTSNTQLCGVCCINNNCSLCGNGQPIQLTPEQQEEIEKTINSVITNVGNFLNKLFENLGYDLSQLGTSIQNIVNQIMKSVVGPWMDLLNY